MKEWSKKNFYKRSSKYTFTELYYVTSNSSSSSYIETFREFTSSEFSKIEFARLSFSLMEGQFVYWTSGVWKFKELISQIMERWSGAGFMEARTTFRLRRRDGGRHLAATRQNLPGVGQSRHNILKSFLLHIQNLCIGQKHVENLTPYLNSAVLIN